MSVDFGVRGQKGVDVFTGGSVFMDYKLVFFARSNGLKLKCPNDGLVFFYKHTAFCFTRG